MDSFIHGLDATCGHTIRNQQHHDVTRFPPPPPSLFRQSGFNNDIQINVALPPSNVHQYK